MNEVQHLTGNEDKMSVFLLEPKLYIATAGSVVVEGLDITRQMEVNTQWLNDALTAAVVQ